MFMKECHLFCFCLFLKHANMYIVTCLWLQSVLKTSWFATISPQRTFKARECHAYGSSNGLRGTPCVTCMPGFLSGCYASVSSWKKRPEQVCKEEVIFCMQQGAIMQTGSCFLTRIKEKTRARGWHLWTGGGVVVIAAVRYCCPQCTYDEWITLQ